MNAHEISPNIEESWKRVLWEEFQKPYFKELRFFLYTEKSAGKKIFPQGALIFNAFNTTPFSEVKVVILGQDPYHDDGQAHGLSFSVREGVKLPPSLKNIYKELVEDVGIKMPASGDLTPWAKQGVLMLNSILTVEAHQAASHRGKGWETFTDRVIYTISEQREGVVFILWGRYAQGKSVLIDRNKHLVLESAHPSPFSATKFFGCKHFSKTNQYLIQKGKMPINWSL
ncbi:MAG: uracil-DNA glycosylase [Chitinophagales bacterium]|nr:uracil-DNA glycosylase [Chitinophagales bacterium]